MGTAEITVVEEVVMRSRSSSSSPLLAFPADNAMNNNYNRTKDLPTLSLNHVSFLCKSVTKSVQFYEQVLGFGLIKRPSSFDFEGAWLFNHGVGIHLLEAEKVGKEKKKGRINPKDNHISFQCSDMDVIMKKLEGMGVEYVKGVVREGGIVVDQIFFHDPDGYMIEICNCQNLPLLPLSSSSSSCPLPKNTLTTSSSFYGNMHCSGEVEALMMENLALGMMNISI
ncbi:uncharacterized protein LOC105172535 [Sesamum indicum]|uniref:Uncharacterized protein LOC105172535 n=1 Tax=Sesamum indicum TaxID=4182 RepID=A0A6I9U0Q8_SESIN|nr:uncharacterized protein LOC105172535 [Sesamum indicum]